MDLSAAFLGASFLLLMTPGPTNTLLAAAGARHGLARSALLPLAESLGYCVAISTLVIATGFFRDAVWLAITVKLLAAAWLALSAVRLWRLRFDLSAESGGNRFSRVFLATLFNPKALLVATVLIPETGLLQSIPSITAYAALSALTGYAWVWLGSAMPGGARVHAYRFSAIVLTVFSALAAYSSTQH